MECLLTAQNYFVAGDSDAPKTMQSRLPEGILYDSDEERSQHTRT